MLQTDYIIHIMERICLLRKAEGQKKNQSQLSEQGSPMLEHQDTTSI